MSIWVFIILLIVVGLIAGFSEDKKNRTTINDTKKTQEEFIINNGINIDVEYEWRGSLNRDFIRFIADDSARKVYISSGINSSAFEIIPFEEIIGFEIFEDSQVVGGIKRAIVGGVLAGAAGAIVGAQTANKKEVSSLNAVLYRENVSNPQYMFSLIRSKTKTKDIDYRTARSFLNNINATIKAIVAKTDHVIRPEKQRGTIVRSTYEPNNNEDILARLQKLKTVYENDLISETDYEEKKKELLEKL